jgi:hypothetical protein
VAAVAFLPDTSALVTAAADGTVSFWILDALTGSTQQASPSPARPPAAASTKRSGRPGCQAPPTSRLAPMATAIRQARLIDVPCGSNGKIMLRAVQLPTEQPLSDNVVLVPR